MLELVTCSCLDAGESKFVVSSPILLLFKMIINHPLSSAGHVGLYPQCSYSLFKFLMKTRDNVCSYYGFIIQCKMSAGKHIPSQSSLGEVFSSPD